MKQLGIAFALLVVAVVLLLLLLPLAVLVGTYNLIRYKNRLERMAETLMEAAYALDVFGNVAYSGLLNFLFAKGNSYLHGNPRESVSSALGKRWTQGKLTVLGSGLVRLLNTINYDHCWKYIEGVWDRSVRPQDPSKGDTILFLFFALCLLSLYVLYFWY